MIEGFWRVASRWFVFSATGCGEVSLVVWVKRVPEEGTRFCLSKSKSVYEMVPMEGLEPPRSHEHQILSLARLPIPPHRRPKRVVEKGGLKLVHEQMRVKAGTCLHLPRVPRSEFCWLWRGDRE